MNKVKLFIPGRIEIIGNHTDHQNGKVICSSINLGNTIKAKKIDQPLIIIQSKNYGAIKIDYDTLEIKNNTMPINSVRMIIGILTELKSRNYLVKGAIIKIDSNLPVGVGLGSSAAFCLSIVCSLNNLFNFKITKLERAKICQIVENKYIGKDSGLMDQIACLSKGLIKIDFKKPDEPIITNLNIDLKKFNYSISIINSEISHDKFSLEYSEIKNEMQEVAKYFEKKV